MAMQSRTLSSFGSMRQDRNDYISSPDTSPDACNMDTRDGCLAVASGFSPAVQSTAPGSERLKRLYGYAGPNGLQFLVCTDTKLYACDADSAGRFERAVAMSEEVNLAASEVFSELYLRRMHFDDV